MGLRRGALLVDAADGPWSHGAGWLESVRFDARQLPTRQLSARQPLAEQARAETAFGGEKAARHGAGCACCVVRATLVNTLILLYQRRARGTLSFFRHVVLVVSAARQADVSASLRADAVFRSIFALEMDG